jgi:AraC-like DNA-binding protein
MIEFTTDEIDPADRFEHWREVRSKSLFGVTIDLAAEHRASFEGAFRARRVGNAVASEMIATSYKVSRTSADIARVAGNSLCIAMQVKGPGTLDPGRDRAGAVSEGDMTISHSDLPYAATPDRHGRFQYRMIKVPFEDELMLGKSIEDLFAATFKADNEIARPFRALFNAVTGNRNALVRPDQAITSITRLAMLARGKLAPGLPEVRAAMRTGLLHTAFEIMARDKHNGRLTPALVARELGISLRQVHVVFENAEMSFSRSLTDMRIEEARRLLLEAPNLPVTQIAYTCGFESLATFYRAFTRRYGMTPKELRYGS